MRTAEGCDVVVTETARLTGCPDGIADAALYVGGERAARGMTLREALAYAGDHADAFVWLGLHDPPATVADELADTCRLDPSVVQDALDATPRPRLDEYDGVALLSLRTVRYVPHDGLHAASEIVDTGTLIVVVADRLLVTVRRGHAASLAPLRVRLEASPERLAEGGWRVAYEIVARQVDAYLAVAAACEEDVDRIEQMVFDPRAAIDLPALYTLKREMAELRHAVSPLREPLTALSDEDNSPAPEPLRRRFRRRADHLTGVTERLAVLDDLIHTVLQARFAQVSMAQNNDMRTIASWAAIGASETLIAGVYGMNFDHMPELHWQYGYPLCLAAMVVTAFGLYRLFRRLGWL